MKFISEEFFWKIFKNKDFGLDVFEKGRILRPFSIENLNGSIKSIFHTYFQENRRGWNPPLPPVLTVPKKRGPKRVKECENVMTNKLIASGASLLKRIRI